MKTFIRNNKSSILTIIKILVSYSILSGFFYAYTGLIYKSGSYYSPFLAKYSLIQFIQDCIIYPVKFSLEVLGYSSRYSDDRIGILNGSGVRIAHACLGIKIMIAYTALIISFNGKKKILFWILGILGIQIINIIRIFILIHFNKAFPNIVENSHIAFNTLSYILIFAFFYIWHKKHSV